MKATTLNIYLTKTLLNKIRDQKALRFKSHVDIQSYITYIKANSNKTITKLTKHLYTISDDENIELISDRQLCLPKDSSDLFKFSLFTGVDLHNVSGTEAEVMDAMFYYYRGDFVDLSSLDSSNVRSMRWMFCNAKIKHLDIRNLNTSKVRNMRMMFTDSEIEQLETNTDIVNMEELVNKGDVGDVQLL